MLKKAVAVVTLAIVAALGIQPSAATAGPLPNAVRGQDQGVGQNDDGPGQGRDGHGQGHGRGHGGYVPNGSIIITGLPIPGGTIIISFGPSSFRPGEQVVITVGDRTVGGGHRVTLAAVKADVATLAKTAAADGSLKVTMNLPSDASGTQSVTATGVTSGNVGTAATTIMPADVSQPASSTLAATGSTLPFLLIWIGAGALILGAAIVATLAFVRRERHAV